MSSLQQYLDLYRDAHDLIAQHSCAVLNERRQEVAQLLQDRQLPNTKVERYKYTNADAAFAPDFGINLKRLLEVLRLKSSASAVCQDSPLMPCM